MQSSVFPRHKENIVRRDIPMKDSMAVHLIERFQDRHYHFQCLLFRQSADPLQMIFQRFTVEVFHHDIGRIVCLETIENVHNTVHIAKLRKLACFL